MNWLRKHRKRLWIFFAVAVAALIVSVILWPGHLTSPQNIILLVVAVIAGTANVLSNLKSWFEEKKRDKPTEPGSSAIGEQVQVVSGREARGVQVKDGNYYEGGEHYHVETVSRPPAGSTPPASEAFQYIPRGQIEQEIRAALKNGANTALVGVGGMGGLGKTELALHLAADLEAESPAVPFG